MPRPDVVAHFSEWWPPASNGGVEIFLKSLLEKQRRRGLKVVTIGPATAGQPLDTITDSHFSFEVSPGADRDDVVEQFRRWLRSHRPSVLHFHSTALPHLEDFADVGETMGAKSVLSVHLPDIGCVKGTLTRENGSPCTIMPSLDVCRKCASSSSSASLGSLDSVFSSKQRQVRALARMRKIMCPAGWLVAHLERLGTERSRLLHVPHASSIPTPVSQLARKDDHPGLRIGFFGRSNPTKGIATVAEAVAFLPDDIDVTLECYCVCNTEEAETYRKWLSRRYASDRVRFHDGVPYSDIGSTLAGFDIIAVPSLWMEVGPLIALDALRVGVPVLGSDAGGIREIISNGLNGWLVPTGDLKAWRTVILELYFARNRISEVRDYLMGIPARSFEDLLDEIWRIYSE